MAEAGEIWVEKYRPKKLSEIVGQDHAVSRLQTFVKEKSLPHLLFAGPPGNGKTTAALCIARELFGEGWRQNLLELNASVAPETPIMVRKNGRVKRTTFGRLAKELFTGNFSSRAKTNGLEILSIDKNYNVRFARSSLISRHKVSKVARIRYEGGVVRTSLDHSVIVVDEKGSLVSKRVSEMKMGDLLITFKTVLPRIKNTIDLRGYPPQLQNRLRSGLVRNPKIKRTFDVIPLNRKLSWLLGVFLAEGCTSFKGNTSGQVIFSLAYPQEERLAEEIQKIVRENLGLESKTALAPSGFDREKLSSIQVRVLNTQLAKFFKDNFHASNGKKNALTKRVPPLLFEASLENRKAFLKGYMADGCGDWGGLVRYSSRSEENLIDIAWLGRISGLDTSCFDGEARVVWKLPSYSYIKTEFMPAKPILEFFERIWPKTKLLYKRVLRHQLYWKKSGRISKETARGLLKQIDVDKLSIEEKTIFKNLSKLIDAPLSFVLIKDVKIEGYDDYVYDISVPGVEMFWGGTTPILLHNSDERGINTIRTKVKDYARTRPIGDVPYKIIYLDESDALTPDAQHALRRTMEMYTHTCRFILACNYSSKIIEPIQSRCAVFRFKRLDEKDISKVLKRIVKDEKLNLAKSAIDAIIYISEGDMRRAINLLQAASALGKKITEKTIYEVSVTARPEDVKEMMKLALGGEFERARDKLLELLIGQGLSGEDILQQVHREIFNLELPEPVKVKLIDRMGEFDFRLIEGANERIQLEAALAHLSLVGNRLRS